MKKVLKILCLVFIMFFVINTNVNAALPTSLTGIAQVGDTVRDSSGYGMALKVARDNNAALLCTDYSKYSPASRTDSCTITNDWSEKVRYAIAKVISSASDINTSALTPDYFAAQLAINQFLYNKKLGGYNLTGTLSSTYKSKFDNFLSIANSAYDEYDSISKVSLKLSSSTLTFTLIGNYYVSNTITITGSNINTSNLKIVPSIGLIEYKNDAKTQIAVKVPKEAATSKLSVSLTVTADISQKIPQARNYDCGDDTIQTVTPAIVEYITKTTSANASGSITPLGTLKLKKVDKDGKLVAGAKFKITGPNNYSKEVTTSSTSENVLTDLAYGVYTITELEAPDRYVKISDSKTITISATNINGSVSITNNLNKVIISKLGLTNSKLLPGATLEIQDKDGKVVNYCLDENGKNIECKWVSTDKAYEIEGFPNGTYYLVEISSPDGFIINTEKVKFVVDGSIEEVKVEMKNTSTKVLINKISSDTGKILPGAKLQIQDENGTKLYEWITNSEVYEIEGLSQGTYYLVEISAPEGYELNTEKIKFVVDDKTEIIKVEMENDVIVDVPNTLSSKSALLIAFAMFDIALGIGIVIYVKKSKVQE